jgi:hypothetical protein
MLIRSVDAPTPCGNVGTITLTDKVKTDLCTKKTITPLYEIIRVTPNIATHTINSSQITFTLSKTEAPIAEIEYKVSCGMFSNIGLITVVPGSLCNNLTIPIGKVCDPCTGAFSDAPTDVVIGTGNDNSQTDIIIG